MPTPVFALAFANDHDPQGRYLPGLATELRGVRQALDPAAGGDRWRVVERANATIDDLLGLFDANRGAVVALHYGGHAAGYGLLLESETSHPRLAHAGGLARFLGQQSGLQLAFLNGCSTEGQVRDLLAAGVPAVIATEREIEDAIATEFSTRFYRALAGGQTIAAAFDEARGAVEAARGTVAGAPNASRKIDVSDDAPADAAPNAVFPWVLHVAEGAERVREWHLGLATGDPLFGLPPLPPADLPAEPFRHLQWFAPEHAALFFGRGVEIRALYERVTQPGAPPITLLYGQAGAGKSSLLAAGLTPRLRATHLVAYLRRDEVLGLPGVLRKAFALGADAPLPADAWRALEARLGRPVVIVIDQVEEAFTRPRPATDAARSAGPGGVGMVPPAAPAGGRVEVGGPPPSTSDPASGAPTTDGDAELRALYGLPAPAPAAPPRPVDELGAFVADLVTMFRDQAARPNGRLVLGFRKEWLAEVRARLQEARLPFGDVFLDRLGRSGIVEAVTGPAREPALRAQYKLAIEDGLAEVIADDLLVDPDSPVAPTLQVLLAKLWRASPAGRDGARRFDRALYQPLKDEGILLGDFLDQQLETLGTTHAAAVESGLALDVLAFHTTPHRTACTRSRAELRATYPQSADALPGLVQRCVDLYLLATPSDEATTASGDAMRIAHDTLAPLVRDRLEASDRPAQRARRILEGRVGEWADGRTGRLLDDVDLASVEAGAAMRAWTPDELRLVAASRAAARARSAERTLAQAAAADDPLEAARLLAQLADDPEPPNGLAIASRVARQALPIAMIDPAREAGALASGGVLQLAFDPDDGSLVVLGAGWVQRRALQDAPGAELRPLLAWDEPVRIVDGQPVVLARDGRRAAVATGDVALVWSLDAADAPLYLTTSPDDATAEQRQAQSVMNLWFDEQGDVLLTTTASEVHVWNLADGSRVATVPGGPLCRPALSANARWLAVGGDRVAAKLYELADDGTPTERLSLGGEEDSVVGLTFDLAESRLIGKTIEGPMRLWKLDDLAAAPIVLDGSNDLSCAAFSPGYYEVAGGSADGSVRSWFFDSNIPPDVVRAHDREVEGVVFAPNGDTLLSISADGTAKLWDRPVFTELATLGGHRGTIRSAAFSPDGARVVTVGDGDAVRVWSARVEPATEPLLLRGHRDNFGQTSYDGESGWRPVHVSPDSRHFAIAAPDGTVRVTPLVGEPTTVTLRYRDKDAVTPQCATLGIADGRVTVVLDDGAVFRSAVDADAALTTPARAGGRAVAAAAVSPDGGTVALAFGDDAEHLVHLWSLDRPGDDRVLRGHTDAVDYITFSPDGRRVATSARDVTARVWPVDGAGDPAASLVCVNAVGTPAFGADGARVAAVTIDGGVAVWGGGTDGSVPTDMPSAPSRPNVVAFAGGAVVVGAEDTTVAVWRPDAAPSTRLLSGHRGPVRTVAASADGRLILTTSDDGTARVRRVDGAGTPVVLVAGREEVQSAAFTPDGRRVVAIDKGGVVRAWSVSWEDLARKARDAVAALGTA